MCLLTAYKSSMPTGQLGLAYTRHGKTGRMREKQPELSVAATKTCMLVSWRLPSSWPTVRVPSAGWESADHLSGDRRYLTTLGIGAYTNSGVIGRPSLATADKGNAVLSYLGQSAGRLINLVTAQAD